MAIKIGDRLGTGAQASVWKATDRFGRTVAVKILRPSGAFFGAALEHAKALAKVSHKNVVTVYSIEPVIDPDSHEESEGIVMEYIEGSTLSERIKKGSISRQELISLSVGLIDGLESIHTSGATHNDFHEENVLLSKNGEVKIIDMFRQDSLSKISEGTKKSRINADKSQLTTIIYDICTKSELSSQSIDNFKLTLKTSHNFDQLRENVRRLAQVDTLEHANTIHLSQSKQDAPLHWYRTRFPNPDSHSIVPISRENNIYKTYSSHGAITHLIVIFATEENALMNYTRYIDSLIDLLIAKCDLTNISALLVLDAKPSKEFDRIDFEQALRRKIYQHRLLVFLTLGYIQSEQIFTEVKSIALGPIYY